MSLGPFSSESRTEASPITQSAAFSEIGGAATSLNINSRGKRAGATVNLLDGGAIQSSFAFASSAQAEALRQVESAGARYDSTVREAIAAVSESARDDAENVTLTAIKWGAFALLGWAAFQAFGKR